MKAAVHDSYGSPDAVEVREIDKPVPGDHEVLVKGRAASVNPVDWHDLTFTPYVARVMAGLRKPKSTSLGVDYAGQVEAVGRDVTLLRPGDEVFATGTARSQSACALGRIEEWC